MMLKREGTAGVWGVCGESGFPGEEDDDTEVPVTIGGMLDSCRLEELEDRFKTKEEDRDSDNTAFDSRMR